MDKHILIIDDTPDNLRLLSVLLSKEGYQVRAAPSGARALASLERNVPDVILLDILMPEMDGYEVCRRLKRDERTRDVPVIFISALDDVLDKVTAFSVGGVDYITKPFQREEVLARVNTHVTLQEMHRTLRAKNDQLEAQNAELDSFAHTVAHDLKNPLSVVLGYAYLLYDDAADMTLESLHEVARNIRRSTQKSIDIVNALLLLASVRKEEVEPARLDMTAILNQVLERLAMMADEYDARISLPESWHTALGYAPWVEEVWVNYVSNGIKYGGSPPHLELGSDAAGDGMIRFWVRDYGQGLTAEEQAVLFTEFRRLTEVNVEGHGMGLSIVRRIVDKLGGEVGVESEAGVGSLFYFTLSEA